MDSNNIRITLVGTQDEQKKLWPKNSLAQRRERRRCSLSCSRHAGVTYPYWK